MIHYRLFTALLGLSLLALSSERPALGQDAAPHDHPLVSRFPDAELVRWEFLDGSYTLPLGSLRTRRNAEPELSRSRIINGQVQRRMYGIERRSPVAVYSHYARTLQSQGFNSLFIARGSTLDTTQGSAWMEQVYPQLYGSSTLPLDLSQAQDASARQVLVSRLPRASGDVHVVLLINPRTRNEVFVQLDIIESLPRRPGSDREDWQIWQQELAQSGRAVIDAIRYDSGSIEASGDVDLALAAIAELLQQQRGSRHVLVIHVQADDGSLEAQIDLSQQRADALLARFQAAYPKLEMETRGVGPLSPRADGTAGSSRALNSRVELVRY